MAFKWFLKKICQSERFQLLGESTIWCSVVEPPVFIPNRSSFYDSDGSALIRLENLRRPATIATRMMFDTAVIRKAHGAL
jgi:hypothetical protein